MKQPTIKAQINNFNRMYINDYETARKIILSYRRLCYLSARICDMQNDINYANSNYLKDQEAKEERRAARLNKLLDKYNMVLEYPGIYPIICYKRSDDGRTGEHTYMF